MWIRDDTGRRFEAARLERTESGAEQGATHVLPSDLVRDEEQRGNTLLMTLGALMLAVMAIEFFIFRTAHAAPFCFAGIILVAIGQHLWYGRRERRAVLGRLDRCPSCQYDLTHLSGATRTCPECGGVWRFRERGSQDERHIAEEHVERAHGDDRG